MINPAAFLDVLESHGVGFVTGVPDSQLKSLCEEVYTRYGFNSEKHIVAVNEGNAAGLAAGYHLATGKTALVYLQNSGLGNAVNPITSLTDPAVYAIPVIYIVGWRGEPGIHDEPQHVKQGAITLPLLDTLGITYSVLQERSTIEEVSSLLSGKFSEELAQGRSVAFVVRKGVFEKSTSSYTKYEGVLTREVAICTLADALGAKDFVVATTGKISRELFEHVKHTNPAMLSHDFLTVGSMGHASSIALSIALQKPQKTIWCFDGDGAVLMHMGSLATIGTMQPQNLIHVVLDNEAHESVGGMPTVTGRIDIPKVALSCGYAKTLTINTKEALKEFLESDVSSLVKPLLVHVIVSSGSRADLMRPDTTPIENKKSFMAALEN